MKSHSLFIIVLFCFITLNVYGAITDDLWQVMQKNASDELIPVNVILADNYPMQSDPFLKNELSKKERNEYVVNTLKNFAEKSQAEIFAILENEAKNNKVKDVNPLWISNVISCQATAEVILQLAEMKSIAVIDWDEERNMLIDTRIDENDKSLNKDREITWNISLINAPDVWNQGYTGDGVLVAVIDTGINYNHVDLASHLWEHSDYPNHGFNFHSNNHNTMDDNGHGTHCAGTVASDGTAGSQAGVAPDATIMGLKVLDGSGNGSESNVWQAIQFSVTHQVDVMSISLGWMHSWNPNRTTWRNTMDNALAAGLVAAVAAGNSGNEQWLYPVPDNVATPGDCPPPWLHPDQTLTSSVSAVICVGSTTNTNAISNFSSRGPVTWQNVSGYNDYEHQPGIGLIRPDIVAPGSHIKSLAHNNNHGYVDGWSGTSMATPAVAGTIALMLSKNPYLTPAEISQILEETTLQLSSNKSNTFGSGRVDALAAVNATNSPDMPPAHVINPFPADNAASVAPASLVLQWQQGAGPTPDFYQISIGTDNPPTNMVFDSIVLDNFYVTNQLFDNNETYYWKVNAYNDFGSIEGEIWNFTTLGLPDEDFESGDFSMFPWQFSGHSEWQITSDTAASGSFSIQSGPVNAYENSTISIEINVVEAGDIVFWKKVSSKENEDKLRFSINGYIEADWSGEIGWSQEVYYLEEGYYELMWKYQKLHYDFEGEDCAWLDYIVFPELGDLNPPALDVSITEIVHETGLYEISSETFHITNSGGGVIDYSLGITYQSDETGWLGLNMASGELHENESNEIIITFYPANIYAGVFQATLQIHHNLGTPYEIPIELTVNATSADIVSLPLKTALLSNFPNPFNPETTIHFAIAETNHVEINIFNSKGQLLQTILNKTKQPGYYNAVWHGKNAKGQAMPSGIYFYQLKTNEQTQIKKMLMLK